MPERNLLRSRFGMKIYQDCFCLLTDLFENRIHQKERIVHIRFHKCPPHRIDHPQLFSVSRHHNKPLPWAGAGEIKRSDQSGLLSKETHDFPLVPTVIPQSDHVHLCPENIVCELRGNPVSTRHILPIHHDEIRGKLLDQPRHHVPQSLPAMLGHNIP